MLCSRVTHAPCMLKYARHVCDCSAHDRVLCTSQGTNDQVHNVTVRQDQLIALVLNPCHFASSTTKPNIGRPFFLASISFLFGTAKFSADRVESRSHCDLMSESMPANKVVICSQCPTILDNILQACTKQVDCCLHAISMLNII